ncbi:hypothetical protein AYI68_g2939 [Smittium mucronatum]|uniref:Uncharacterized protein n=1 Tax=Smittium mucronatum TaxID=133383 RepID=A0A1R0H1B5_9FUNG|nr:hypothetical protein AYI68_g2939 [Smittium mucronatum]
MGSFRDHKSNKLMVKKACYAAYSFSSWSEVPIRLKIHQRTEERKICGKKKLDESSAGVPLPKTWPPGHR